jgi:uncharacterized membrane protein YdbT with pleckstrin-like domain
MSYIDKNLLPDEKILFRTRKHLIIFFFPVAWLIFCGFAVPYMQANPILAKLDWAPWLVALIFWGQVGLDWITSEFAVTNKRVMMREGFFYRHANEMRISAIAQVNVDQSLLGQVLNYGSVSINAFGATDAYSMIAKPFIFQKCVNEQLDKITR